MKSQAGKKNLEILLVFRLYSQSEILPLINIVIKKLHACSQQQYSPIFYFMDQITTSKLQSTNQYATCKWFNRVENQDCIDLVVTVGGDGTILYAAKEFRKATPAFLTFQKGTLGFLCKYSSQGIQNTLQIFMKKFREDRNKQKSRKHLKLGFEQQQVEKQADNLQNKNKNDHEHQGQFEICKLMRLNVNIHKYLDGSLIDNKVVLNQAAITRKDSQLITLQIYIDNQYITTTSGDGILVSSPTGSTAYALSAGGPVVLNGVNTILLVPIAPNSLSFRPICLPASSKVKIKMSQKSKSNALVSFDGQSNMQLTQNEQLLISHESGDKNCDLLLYEPKNKKREDSKNKENVINGQNNGQSLPTWMQRLKLFLGWNQVFKSPTCHVLAKQLSKIQ